jgi:SNF2 family DNA or RNA helicase
MKRIGKDWWSLDADEIKRYLGTARGVSSVPGMKILGSPASGSCRVDVHRSHLPLLPGLSPDALPGDNHEIPEASRGWLRPFQLEAVRWIRERSGCILALDLGGGKTAVATAAADLPVVVGVPVSVIDVWRTECERLGWTYHLCQDVEPFKEALKAGKTDCFIMPYSRADKLAGYFTVHKMGTVIADEAHVLTSKYVSWSQAFRGVPRERTILLTATPMRNRLSSLWGLLDTACPGAFGGRNSFRLHYCGAQRNPYGGVIDGPRTNTEELAGRLTEVVFKLTRAQMGVALPGHERKIIHTLITGAFPSLEELLQGVKTPTGAHLTIINDLRQHLSIRKAEIIPVEQYMSNHCRVIWWIWYKATARILVERLTRAGYNVDVMTGDSPTKKRSKILTEWSNPNHVNKPRALVASVAAASTGISLANAHAAVFIDLDWTPLNLIQAEKRHHRFGSFLPKLYTYYIQAKGTIDDHMARALIEKQVDSEVSLGEDGSLAQMRALLNESDEVFSEQEIVYNLAQRMLRESHHEENR